MFLLRQVLVPVLLLASGLEAQQPAHAFVDVAVLSMERSSVLEHQTVLVIGDRITAIGPAGQVQTPSGAITVDGRSRFLLPALGDAHVHLSTPGGTPQLAERALTLLALNGVGMARSMYTEPHHADAATAIREGRLLGPRLQLVSPPLSGQSAPTAAAAVEAVRRHAAAGYRVIKILPGLTCHVFDSVAAETRRQGLALVGHVPVDVGLRHALESGYISIEHLDGLLEALLRPDTMSPSQGGFFGFGLLDAIDENRLSEVVALVKASGVTIVPTETGMESFVSTEPGAKLAERPAMRFVPQPLVAQWTQQKDGFARGVGVTAERAARYQAIRRRLIVELHRAGVPIALGSDGWSLFHVPGFSTLDELEVYVAAGLSPYDALRTATVNVARLMGLEEGAGLVKAGAPADLLLLEANPLEDITAVRRQAGVMIRGQWLSRADIDQRLAVFGR